MAESADVSTKDIPKTPDILPPKTITTEQYQELSDAFTRVTEDKMRIQEELAALRVSNDASAILNKLIIPYAHRAFVFMCLYCAFVAFLLLDNAHGPRVSDKVLEILVGSTAVTVIGLVGMVMAGIFRGARRSH